MRYDKAALAAELSEDPHGRSYATLSDADVAAAMNRVDVPRNQRASIVRLLHYLIGENLLLGIVQEADGSGAGRAAALALLEVLRSPHMADIDVHDPIFLAQVSSLIAAGRMNETHRDEVQALFGTKLCSPAELRGLPPVAEAWITRARRT